MALVFKAPGLLRSKPVGNLAIDWSNPLTNGLVDCLVFSEGGGAPINLGCPHLAVTLTSSPTWVMTQMGPAGNVSGGSAFVAPNRYPSFLLADFAFRAIVIPSTWVGDFTALVDKYGSTGGIGRQLSLFFDTTGKLEYYGIAGNENSVAGSIAMPVGSISDYVLTRNGTAVKDYVNGLQSTSFTQAGAGSNTFPAPMALGSNPSAGGTVFSGSYLLVQTWSRGLSQDEIIGLYTNPWGMFVPAEGEMPALFVASAPETITIDKWWQPPFYRPPKTELVPY